ncbi:hypothetical protein LPH56_09025 [Xylella taiwanensis]|uniref:Uncharacterized protein n=1 Tax=Xylella taiwanensis TaxID=1444770 RepID=Z9JHU2_9GAMM|nr:hypothetical protein [Xylella taiwanensis]EWS77960.1 hypothetical protein AF72_08185 [Xylella taiwanensis]UFM93397.1 hypothetical protein LPH39_09850 [Xylella taiwanensis]UFN01982.1 hypothetical protein LPH43_09915 [Xylella taiwanensis]UFN06449.1 hypothetical protein LPH42_09715 [Xylella taiwanensis]UFN08743.1 hypothetical protein LPH45_09725 [Xylella taiwanensis]
MEVISFLACGNDPGGDAGHNGRRTRHGCSHVSLSGVVFPHTAQTEASDLNALL